MTQNPTRKYAGLKQLSTALNFVTKPVFSKRGFVENKILTDWPVIVGKGLADCSAPRKLLFAREKRVDGVLHVEVYDSGMAMEMTYMEPIILEKIASYFGYRAIAKLKIIQKPGGMMEQAKKNPRAITPLDASKKQALSTSLEGIDDEELKAALARLGEDVLTDC